MVAVRDPSSVSGISSTMPTAVPTAIAEIVAHRPSPKVSPTQPKATAPSPTELPRKMMENVGRRGAVDLGNAVDAVALEAGGVEAGGVEAGPLGPGRFGTAVPAAPYGACLVLR